MLQNESREISIFSEVEQVLLVEGVDIVLSIVINHKIGYKQRAALVRCTQSE